MCTKNNNEAYSVQLSSKDYQRECEGPNYGGDFNCIFVNLLNIWAPSWIKKWKIYQFKRQHYPLA